MSTWNHRLLAHEHKGEVYFQIHQVSYTDGVPKGYTESGVSVWGHTVEEITWALNMMLECCEKPILWAGDRWPEEFKLK